MGISVRTARETRVAVNKENVGLPVDRRHAYGREEERGMDWCASTSQRVPVLRPSGPRACQTCRPYGR